MKHVGKMKNNSAKVAVVYRTLPNEPTNALVVGTNGLPDSHHDSLMSLIESDSGQQAYELAEVLATRRFPDGSVMLAYLHQNGHLKKVSTSMVLMTPNSVTQVPLDQLNELIAKDKGVTVAELSVKDDLSSDKEAKSAQSSVSDVIVETEKSPAITEVTESPKSDTPVTASDLRSMADKLFKEAQALRRKADELEPAKAKKASKAEVQ
jgi:hypothetical protein